MTTPLIILCILVLPLLATLAIGGTDKARLGGVIGIALAFAFFAVGHFFKTEAMTQMLPPFVPFARLLVLATGVLELAIALALVYPASQRLAGFAAIGVFVVFFPANIFAAVNHVDMGGHVWGPAYLLIRGPLQALLIWWVWYFVLHLQESDTKPLRMSS